MTISIAYQPARCAVLVAIVALVAPRLPAALIIVDVVGNITPLNEYTTNFSPGAQPYQDWGNEPFVAVNPLNPQQIVVSGFAYGSPTGTLFYSTNGGTNWGARFPMTNPPGLPNGSAPHDQTYFYDANGILHGAVLAANGSGFDVYHSTTTDPNKDGFFGRPATVWNWNASPVSNVGAGNADQPWIAGSGNHVYVAYDDFTLFGLPRVATSVNGGASFATNNPVFLGSPGFSFVNPGLRISADSNNNVYAIYGQGTSSSGGAEHVNYALNRSIDGGQTWQYTNSTPGIGGLPIDNGFSAQIGVSFGGKNELLGNTTAITSDALGNHVYEVYGKRDGSNVDRLWLAEFHNNAGNLVERANPMAFSPAGQWAALPSITVAANGALGIMYTTFDGLLYHEHLATSTDLGMTFTDQDIYDWNPVFITLGSSAFPSSNRALGDYNFITSIGNTLYGVFPGQGNVNGGGYNTIGSVDPMFFTVTVPEPATLVLAGFGVCAILLAGSRTKRARLGSA